MKKHTYLYLAMVLTACLWHDSAPTTVSGQVLVLPLPPPPPLNQRQSYQQLQMQIDWFQNATRTAPMFNTGADTTLWTHFEGLRIGFGEFTRSLSPAQLQRGANDLAELDAGLAIIGEAFPNFQDDLNSGRHPTEAIRTLCQVLRDSVKLWGQQLRVVSQRLRVAR